jgi:hypothetical protein
LHLRDGSEELLDPDGQEFETLSALREAVLFTARDLMTGDVRNGVIDLGFRIDAEDEAGTVVHSMPFKYALNIIPEEGPGPIAAAF